MGIRRRRKKLTSLISNMDRRIRSVEFKKTAYGTTATSESEGSDEEEVIGNEPDGSVYSPTLPNPWTRIKRAYFHPSNAVAGDRFELLYYTTEGIESVSGASVERGDYVSISAIGRTAAPVITVGRTYFKNTNASNPFYTCRAHGTPSWSLSATNTRESLLFKGAQVYVPLPISGDSFGTVTHTYLFSHGSTVSATGYRYSLATRALIASHSATTTTATLTIGTSSHHYTEGDIIDVNDLPEAYRGVDGLFEVTAVTSTTISYEFDTPLTAAISSATADPGTYVYSVAQKYVRVGSTWFDTANENKVYYWTGLRYQSTPVTGLQNDGSAPSPPTDLTLTTTGYARADGTSRSRVDLSWTAPTTSANGNSLDDLLGYKIRISETGYSNWRDTKELIGPTTSETITGLDPDKEYFFRVTAYDSFGNESTELDGSIVTGLAALELEKPSAPTIPTPRLGVASVSWDGKDYNGATVKQDMIKFLEVHASVTSGYTPGPSTLVGKIYRASDPCLVSGLVYNSTYYFKLIAIDKSDNSTAASDQTSTIIKPLVDTDIIGKVLDGANIKDGSITASDVIIGNTITGGLIQALAITAGKIDANAITADKINAGAITAVKIEAGAVTAGKIEAGSITGDRVNATTSINFTSGTSSATIGTGAIAGQGGYATGLSVTAGGSTGDFGTYNDGNGVQVARRGTPSNSGLFIYSTGVSLTHYEYTGSIGIQNVNSTGGAYVDAGGGHLQLNGNIVYVSAANQLYVSYNNSGNAAVIRATTGSGASMLVGNGLGGTTNQTLDVYGRIRATGSITANTSISSIRYKTDIREFLVPDALFDIAPKIFKYDNEKRYATWEDKTLGMDKYSEDTLGVIAEDFIEAGLDYLVEYNEEGLPESLDYSRIAVLLIPAIKELREEIKALKLGMNK